MTKIRRHLSGLGLILLTALLLRLIWIAYIRPDPTDGRFDDTAWYRGAGHFLARGEGYLNPYAGTPTAAWLVAKAAWECIAAYAPSVLASGTLSSTDVAKLPGQAEHVAQQLRNLWMAHISSQGVGALAFSKATSI